MTTQENRRPHSASAVVDRRSSPRLEVLERLDGKIRPTHERMMLLNLSQSGFLIEVALHFQIGDIHEFRFTMRDGEPIVVTARVVHEMRANVSGQATFVVGLEFVKGAAQQQAIDTLVQRLRG